MASSVTYVNLTGFKREVTSDELGINIREFKTRVEPEFNEVLPGKNGCGRGRAVASPKKTVSLSGEVGDLTVASGIGLATFTAAFTPVNSSAYFGAPTTGLYLLNAEVTEGREQWKDLSAELEALAGIP